MTSYVYTFLYLQYESYFTHSFWLGLSRSTIMLFIGLQIVAALGFLIGIYHYLTHTPTAGIFATYPVALPVVIALFFIASSLWAPATYYRSHGLVVGSLALTAICSILLLAGVAEDTDPPATALGGWLGLCLVTVLCDGVVWNSRYIQTYVK